MTLPHALEIPVSKLVAAEATPPGSKSVTNRALLLAALAEGESRLTGALDAEDSRMMLDALQTLGVKLEFDPTTREARVQGVGGRFPVKSAELYVGNSGTTARFITAALAFANDCEYRIDGKPRMRERPFNDLVVALSTLGADLRGENAGNYPPLVVRGGAQKSNVGEVEIAANVSSQFLSGLLMAAPLAKRPVVVKINGDLVSKPYVAMTLAVMRAFGVDAKANPAFDRFEDFNVGKYRGREYAIEPDASAASYFFALPAILGGKMTIRNLSRHSLQGDVAFVDALEKMGCKTTWRDDSITVERPRDLSGNLAPLRGVDVDMNACPDVAQTLAVVALFADSPTSVRNVANMRVKETDRIAALATELRKLGAEVEERPDGFTVCPPVDGALKPASIATYDDHRMAMSFALAGLRSPGVVVQDPACVAKTYPNYFDDLARVVRPVDA